MVDLDFKKSSDGRTWSATTKLDVLENYVLPYYAENGINFQTIKEREIAKESKEKVILQNEGDPTPRSVGAMATPPDMNENNTKDDVIKRSRNTLTSLFKIIKNKKELIHLLIKIDHLQIEYIYQKKLYLKQVKKVFFQFYNSF